MKSENSQVWNQMTKMWFKKLKMEIQRQVFWYIQSISKYSPHDYDKYFLNAYICLGLCESLVLTCKKKGDMSPTSVSKRLQSTGGGKK